jgi:hypothetical protein
VVLKEKNSYYSEISQHTNITADIFKISTNYFKKQIVNGEQGKIFREKDQAVQATCTKLFEKALGKKLKLNHQFNKSVFFSSSFIDPHIDYARKTALNFYINTCGESTVFYKPIHDNIEYVVKHKYKTFNVNDIIEVARFTASNNSLFLIDTTTIHNVVNMKAGFERTIFSCSFVEPFDEVYEMLTSTR